MLGKCLSKKWDQCPSDRTTCLAGVNVGEVSVLVRWAPITAKRGKLISLLPAQHSLLCEGLVLVLLWQYWAFYSSLQLHHTM